MLELPHDFPHQPPDDYRYEVVRHKSNVDSIFLVSDHRFVYSGGSQSRTIWGFVKYKRTKRSSSHTYHAPINANKVGKEVDIKNTRPYTAMQLNLTPLEKLLL